MGIVDFLSYKAKLAKLTKLAKLVLGLSAPKIVALRKLN